MLDQERFRQLLCFSHTVLAIACFIFTINTWSVASGDDTRCYMVPCEIGHRFKKIIWAVGDSTVFASVVAGGRCTLVSGAGAALFYKPQYGLAKPMLVGLYLGTTLVAGLAMLDQVGVWSAEWETMGSLSLVSHKDNIFCA